MRGTGCTLAVLLALAVPVSAQDSALSAPAIAPPSVRLPSGTAVAVTLEDELSAKSSKPGDSFAVTVSRDIIAQGMIVIPQGTTGHGEVIYAADKGGFGRAGFIMGTMRTLDLRGETVLLDGRFRVEGKNKNGATAATYFAVGVFAGFINGKTVTLPKGTEILAKTGEEIVFTPPVPSPLPSASTATAHNGPPISAPAKP